MEIKGLEVLDESLCPRPKIIIVQVNMLWNVYQKYLKITYYYN